MWTFVILLIYTISYVLLYFRFGKDHKLLVKRKREAMESSEATEALINASSINNIPALNINTHNDQLQMANRCGRGPVLVSDYFDDHDCRLTCANSNSHAITVDNEHDIYSESTKLKPGHYCKLGPRPECNPRTTVTMLTINSVVCRPRYPNMFGGASGNRIVACNNTKINDPLNVLWDYKFNQVVQTTDVQMTDENEVLDNGKFRFRCKFNGVDAQHNKYIKHPSERLHPIRNYCAQLLYAAHPNVKTIFERNTFRCQCGDPSETRVAHIDANDNTSLCSDKQIKYINEYDNLQTTRKTPYRCFNINSAITDVYKYPPCSEGRFTRKGSLMESVDLKYSNYYNVPIELPMFPDMTKSNVMITIPDYLIG